MQRYRASCRNFSPTASLFLNVSSYYAINVRAGIPFLVSETEAVGRRRAGGLWWNPGDAWNPATCPGMERGTESESGQRSLAKRGARGGLPACEGCLVGERQECGGNPRAGEDGGGSRNE